MPNSNLATFTFPFPGSNFSPSGTTVNQASVDVVFDLGLFISGVDPDLMYVE